MQNIELADISIQAKIADMDWMNPYWLDEVKKAYPDIEEDIVDEIYFKRLKEKVDSLSTEELKTILSEQEEMTSANQNFLLQNIIEEKLGMIA
jgi:hypothetical protein